MKALRNSSLSISLPIKTLLFLSDICEEMGLTASQYINMLILRDLNTSNTENKKEED